MPAEVHIFPGYEFTDNPSIEEARILHPSDYLDLSALVFEWADSYDAKVSNKMAFHETAGNLLIC